MSGNKNALVILWTGDPITDDVVVRIVNLMTSHGITVPELVNVKYYDQNSVSDVILGNTAGKIRVKDIKVEDEKQDPVREAVIFISKRFKAALIGTKGDYAKFASELLISVLSAKHSLRFNPEKQKEDVALLNAIKIIATEKLELSESFCKKYHFTQKVIDLIVNAYEKLF